MRQLSVVLRSFCSISLTTYFMPAPFASHAAVCPCLHWQRLTMCFLKSRKPTEAAIDTTSERLWTTQVVCNAQRRSRHAIVHEHKGIWETDGGAGGCSLCFTVIPWVDGASSSFSLSHIASSLPRSAGGDGEEGLYTPGHTLERVPGIGRKTP